MWSLSTVLRTEVPLLLQCSKGGHWRGLQKESNTVTLQHVNKSYRCWQSGWWCAQVWTVRKSNVFTAWFHHLLHSCSQRCNDSLRRQSFSCPTPDDTQLGIRLSKSSSSSAAAIAVQIVVLSSSQCCRLYCTQQWKMCRLSGHLDIDADISIGVTCTGSPSKLLRKTWVNKVTLSLK